MAAEPQVMTADEYAHFQAQVIAANPDALAQWEIGALWTTPDVDAHLEGIVNGSRKARDWHSPDDVSVLRADDA